MSETDIIEKFLEKFQNIQEVLLDYLDSEENIHENFQNLKELFEETKIRDCIHDFRLFLHFLLKISNNRHRNANFFSKIERILLHFKDELAEFKNDEVFQLFQSNKRVLLFLIEEEILRVDKYFVKRITDGKYLAMKYPQYFAPEIKRFINEEWFPKYDPDERNGWVEDIKKELADNFHENRKIGENESYISQLIRSDSVEDFVAYVNKVCINCDATIAPSIYETNAFLIKKQIRPSKCVSLMKEQS